MGDPLQHAESSARLFGGVPNDYIHIHTIMDSSKLFLADWRHRALLHNTFGIHVFESLIGPSFIRASDSVAVCTRTVVSQHIMEDLKAIPTAGEFLREMPLRSWMAGINSTVKKKMQDMTIEGNCVASMEGKINAGSIVWSLTSTHLPPTVDGVFITAYLVQLANHTTCKAYYNAGTNLWYSNIESTILISAPIYWALWPIGPLP